MQAPSSSCPRHWRDLQVPVVFVWPPPSTHPTGGRCCRNPHKSVQPCAACFLYLVLEVLFVYKAQAAAVLIRFCPSLVRSACVAHLSIHEFHQPPRAPTASKVLSWAVVPALTRLTRLPVFVPGFSASINSDRREMDHFLLRLTGIQNHLASPPGGDSLPHARVGVVICVILIEACLSV